MYNWAEYIDLDNIEEFKTRYNIADWTYDIYDSNEALLTKLQGGATGLYDIASPTAEFVKVMADEGYHRRAATSTASRTRVHQPDVPELLRSQPAPMPSTTSTTSRRTGARPASPSARRFVTEDVKTWKQFFEVAPKYYGPDRHRRVGRRRHDGAPQGTRLLAQLDRPKELGEARELLKGLAPHVLTLDSNDYGDQLATEEAVMGLVWTGGVVDLRDEPETADTEYIVPEDGTLYWMDTWVQFADAPHPEAGLAFLNFIQEPAIQAKETETNRYATANDEAKKLVSPEVLSDPTVFVPDEAFGRLEGAKDVSTDPLRVGDLGGVRLERRRLSPETLDGMTSAAPAVDRRPAT